MSLTRQLVLVFTLPLWLPFALAVGTVRSRRTA